MDDLVKQAEEICETAGWYGEVKIHHTVLSKMADALERLQAELAEARARERRKDAALKPFAEVGQWLFARDVPDGEVMVEFQGLDKYRIELTRKHFKAAHEALVAPAPEPKHKSDCAVHNAPALEPGPCDCSATPTTSEAERRVVDSSQCPKCQGRHYLLTGDPLNPTAACWVCGKYDIEAAQQQDTSDE